MQDNDKMHSYRIYGFTFLDWHIPKNHLGKKWLHTFFAFLFTFLKCHFVYLKYNVLVKLFYDVSNIFYLILVIKTFSLFMDFFAII